MTEQLPIIETHPVLQTECETIAKRARQFAIEAETCSTEAGRGDLGAIRSQAYTLLILAREMTEFSEDLACYVRDYSQRSNP